MRLKIKKIPVIIDMGFAKFLRYYEQVELQESNFNRVCKVLKKSKMLIVAILLSTIIFCISDIKSLIMLNGIFVGVSISIMGYNFIEEFKK